MCPGLRKHQLTSGVMVSHEPLTAALLAAVLADAVDLEGMARGFVIVLAAYFLFQVIDFRGEKLNRASALGAHHVMMAAPIVLVLVAGDSVVKRYFAG